MYISIISVFLSLIPACLSDWKTRTISVSTWNVAAYIGIPCGIFAFLIKLINQEIVIPSLILTLCVVVLFIIVTVILANIKDPLYSQAVCSKCGNPILTPTDLDKCPKCNYTNAKSVLGGADMIALDIIIITSFYMFNFIQIFLFMFIISIILSLILILIYNYIYNYNILEYRVPLIIPITFAYFITLVIIFTQFNIFAIIKF